MAISFLNLGTSAGADTGNITPGAPATPAVDDIWVCFASNSADPAATNMAMNGADWTEIVDGTPEPQIRIGIWWHRYAGVDPDRLITMTDGGGGGRLGQIAAFRGCKSSGSPFNVVGSLNGGDSTAPLHLSVTTTVADCMLLALCGGDNDPSYTPPGGMTTTIDLTGVFTGNDTILGVAREAGIAIGATGNKTATFGAAIHWAAVLVALEPQVAATRAILIQDD